MTNQLNAATETFIQHIQQQADAVNPAWGRVFQKTFADTLQHALVPEANGRMFVLTGDIPAMWQRDSTAQLRPYLILAQQDPDIADIIESVVKRQFFNMDLDPYANAFNETANNAGHQHDHTDMTPWIWERKYELDSLCYPVQLAYLLWRNTGRTSHFDQTFEAAIQKMVTVIETEQHHATSPYRFERTEDRPEDTLINGVGRPVADTGMSWSGFRPSDDANVYGYSIPGNLFAVESLRQLAQIYTDVLQQPEQAAHFNQLAQTIADGVAKFGVTTNQAGEQVFAYEVDGLGHALTIDDANVPNLLSLPYLGAVALDDPIYVATRRTILSAENEYYYAGKFGAGLGSPHTPVEYIWPIALAMQGLTDPDKSRKREILDTLVATTADTDMMHESFNVDDPSQYTREWFSWANMMFCELLLDYFDLRVQR